MILETEHPAYGSFRSIGDPLPFGRISGDQLTPPPLLGQDTGAVLAQLGYSEAEIAGFVEAGSRRRGSLDGQNTEPKDDR